MSKFWRISLKAITDINVLANKVWRNSIDSPNSPNFNHAKLFHRLRYVTGFVKRGLIHASDFATLKEHNFVHG